MKKPVNVADRLILFRTNEGEFRVQVPGDAKITFGPAIPGPAQARNGYTRAEYALRIYQKTKDNLLAVFTGVYTFRDVSLPVSKLVVREAGKAVWKSDERGYKVEESVGRTGEFVDDLHLLAAPGQEDE